jgi:potassium-dependent mechanosensitive channel
MNRMQGCFPAVIGCWLLMAGTLPAQNDTIDDVPGIEQVTLSPQILEEFQKSVAASTELAEAEKTAINEVLQRTAADLKVAEQSEAVAARTEQRLGELEAEKTGLEKRHAAPAASTAIAPGRSISDLESERVELQERLRQREQELQLPTADPAARTASRKAARSRLAEIPPLLDEIEQKLAAAVRGADSPILIQARGMALAAQKRALQAQLSAAQRELALYDAADALNLPTLRREALTRDQSAGLKRLEALTAEINQRRQAEAERRAREAELAKIDAQPLLRPILEENQEIARQEQELRGQHAGDKELLKRVLQRFREIDDDARDARRLDADGGLENGLEKGGLWLRKQRDRLSDLQSLSEEVRKRTGQLNGAVFALFELEDQLDSLKDLDAQADELTALALAAGNVDPDQFRLDALEVLRNQSVNLQKLIDEYGAYTETLEELSREHERLSAVAEEYQGFLEERILWVRSHLPISPASLADEARALADVFSPHSWTAAAKSLGWDAADHLGLYASILLLLIVLLTRRSRHSQQLQEVAQRASGRVNVAMGPTIHCLILTVWISIVWPGLILFLAWRVYESSISSQELRIAALNLARLGSAFFLLEFVRQSVRPFGLAEAHFGWSTRLLRSMRRLLWTIMLFGLPIAAAVAGLHHHDDFSRRDDVERILFMAAMLVLALLGRGLLHPRHGALRQTQSISSDGWPGRLFYLWYALSVAVPILLAGLAYSGYYDTAVRLATKLQRTAWLLVAAVFLYALLGRWLMLRHRKLRIEKAREQLASAQENPLNTTEAGIPLPDLEGSRADLDESNEQSQRMLRVMLGVAFLVGLAFVWADVLPAVRLLDRWTIWSTTTQGIETVTNPATGTVENRPTVDIKTVTLANLLYALLALLLTATAARNLPVLLEMSVLARLPFDNSTAYAITSLTRYGLVMVGIILVSRTLGLAWENVQWLAAALTFGLGFGLQEIFANFVSGLIILFEQPVRVGDIVTIEGVSGVVNRIRIRATTIVDWDRKEYIVPNKEFITGRLLNWTLSDKLNRIVVNVGLEYGSDTALARSIMLEVLEAHPYVLSDPPPMVTLEGFGESTLNFVARAYLPNLENRMATIHDLHTTFHSRLKAEGISLAFPQRELHLRTMPDLSGLLGSVSANGHSDCGSKPHPSPN